MMQMTIQCGKCRKRTMHYDLGEIVHVIDEPFEVYVRKSIVCPKCKEDISDDCFALISAIVMSQLAASIGPVPPHLQGITVVHGNMREEIRAQCKAKLTLVRQFEILYSPGTKRAKEQAERKMIFCSICGKKTKNRVCKDCQYHLDNGADEETIKRMLSDDMTKAIWKENEEYAELLAEAYYGSVIENYKKIDDSKENYGFNTFADGINLGLDIILPLLDEEQILKVREKIESMLEFRMKQK